MVIPAMRESIADAYIDAPRLRATPSINRDAPVTPLVALKRLRLFLESSIRGSANSAGTTWYAVKPYRWSLQIATAEGNINRGERASHMARPCLNCLSADALRVFIVKSHSANSNKPSSGLG